jgi:FixJ family two-component response regulator
MRRASLMKKLEVRTLAELIRLAIECEDPSEGRRLAR